MTRNIGTADRAIRLIVGALLVILPLMTGFAAGTPWLRWGALIVGVVLVATAALRTCPAYSVLGIRTCKP
jgi:Inner membrane protein YgaP-like, transmembrane domain